MKTAIGIALIIGAICFGYMGVQKWNDGTNSYAGGTDAFVTASVYAGTVGIKESALHSVSAYPIPAKDFVKISSAIAILLAETIGWIGTRLDDIATFLIIGAAPFFISLGGSKTWVPRWLLVWDALPQFQG